MYRAARMSQTETRLVAPRQQEETVHIKDLQTIKWVQNVDLVKRSYDFTSTKYNYAKGFSAILAWILGSIEMVIISIYLFIHSLPWPDWVLQIILKIDRLIETILEAVSNKLEWWWDILMVRLMWFRDTIESVIDAFLSLCLFIVYKTIELWMWTVSIIISVLKFIFAPLIWIITTIFPPPEKDSKPPSASPPLPLPPKISALSVPPDSSAAPDSKPGAKEPETEELGRLSGTTSDCESDVSVLSESWTIRHTDQSGKLYNRVEMKATAEGRLRAAMYKRVKAQLSLMRRNSVNFSRGMTSYARQYLEPKVVPVISGLRDWLRDIAAKYGLLDTFDRIVEWIDRHYLISSLVAIGLSFVMVPITIINKILTVRKKKSRRTRSMRSESIRRRAASVSPSVVVPPGLEPLGLIKSEEPVLMEEPEFSPLNKYDKNSPKGSEDESMKDSALASSLDDLYHTSDSTDGSNSFKDLTIHEEDDKQNEDEQETSLMESPQDVSPITTESLNGETPWNTPKSLAEISDMEIKHRTPGGIIILPGKHVSGTSNTNEVDVKTRGYGDERVDVKTRGLKQEVEASKTQENGKQWIGSKTITSSSSSSSPSRTMNSTMKESYAEVTRVEEKDTPCTEDNDKKVKLPKRKISFSLLNN